MYASELVWKEKMTIEKCYIIISYYLQIFDRVLRERVIFGRVN